MLAIQLKETVIFQRNITDLKITTGGRQTSWLFTSMNEELYRVCRESTPAQWSQRGLNPRPLGFKSRCLREKNKSLPSRTCRTQAKYYLRHCKQYCTQGRHNFWADSFAGDLVVSQANQTA